MDYVPPIETLELADLYDIINEQFIDYDAQAAMVEAAVNRWGLEGRRALDLGCATGQHARRLAAAGFQVVGIDISPRLIEIARSKAEEAGLSATFHVGDISALDDDEQFDVALSLNYVLSYLYSNDVLWDCLCAVAQALRPGGLFVFDHHCFLPPHGEAPPAEWTEECRLGDVRLVVRHRQHLEALTGMVHDKLAYEFYRGEKLQKSLTSQEVRRVMFPPDLFMHVENAGFTVLGAFERWDLDTPATTPAFVAVAQRPPSSSEAGESA